MDLAMDLVSEVRFMKTRMSFTRTPGRLLATIAVLANLVGPLVARAQSAPPDWLVNSPTRPTVQQIREARKGWTPFMLPDGSQLPKDPNRPAPSLQNNFKVWFERLELEGPQMIASFESAFPGATWVFMGRDMAVLADLFESFYTAIGQNSRVIRLGMSTATLDSMTQETALQFLKSSGANIDGKTPYLLIDAVSRGGGRQGRALINAVYSEAQAGGKSLSDLLYHFNMIGLRVHTTKIPDIPIQKAQDHLAQDVSALEKDLKKGPVDFGKRHNILSYSDARSIEFLGINESGYTHWTGAWHGSYGAVEKSGGKVFAKPGPASDLAMRQAIVSFQAAIVDLASSPDFRSRVEQAAEKIGYHFPMSRPNYVARPRQALHDGIVAAQNVHEIGEREADFDRVNFGRVTLEQKRRTLKEAVQTLLTTRKPKFQMTADEAVSLRQRVQGKEADIDLDVALVSAVSGAMEKAKAAEVIAPSLASHQYAQFIAPIHQMIVSDAENEGEVAMRSIFGDLLSGRNVDMNLKVKMLDALFKLASTPTERLAVAEKYLTQLSAAGVAGFISQNYNQLFLGIDSSEALKETALKVLKATGHLDASDATRVQIADLFLMQAKSVEEFFIGIDKLMEFGFVAAHREQAISRQLLTFVALKPVAADVNRLAMMITKENKELRERVFMRSLDVLQGREQLDALELPGGMFSRGKALQARIDQFKKDNPAKSPGWMFWAKKPKSCSVALTGK